MSEAEKLFYTIALFNSIMGLYNFSDNEKEKEKQFGLEKKIDRILELLEGSTNDERE